MRARGNSAARGNNDGRSPTEGEPPPGGSSVRLDRSQTGHQGPHEGKHQVEQTDEDRKDSREHQHHRGGTDQVLSGGPDHSAELTSYIAQERPEFLPHPRSSLPPVSLLQPTPEKSRSGRTRTCNPRFWRPVLYQIELQTYTTPSGSPCEPCACGRTGSISCTRPYLDECVGSSSPCSCGDCTPRTPA